MRSTLLTYIFLLVFLAATKVPAQTFPEYLSFLPDKYEIIPFSNTPSGTQSFINAAIEDSNGYIWLSTFDGLYRFDGYQFKAFSLTGDPLGSDGLMVGAAILVKDFLYAPTSRGLMAIHLPSFQVHPLNFPISIPDQVKSNIALHVIQDSNELLWFATESALYKMAYPLQILQEFVYPDSFRVSTYTNVMELEKSIALQTNGDNHLSLLKLDQQSGQFSKWDPFPENTRFTHVQMNDEQMVFVHFSESSKIQIYEKHSGTFQTLYQNLPFLDNSPYVELYRCSLTECMVRVNGRSWLLQTDSIQLFDIPDYVIDPLNAEKVTYSLLRTRGGNSIGYCKNGLIRFVDEHQTFKTLVNHSDYFSAEIENFVSRIWWDGDRRWILNHGDGALLLSPDGQMLDRVFFADTNNIWANYLWNISQYSQDTFWLGTSRGLFWYNTTSKTHGEVLRTGLPEAVSKSAITTQFIDSQGELWMGIGSGNGVVRWAPDRKTFKHYPFAPGKLPFRYPKAIAEDRNKNLWMGCQTGGGLLYWERDTDSFHIVQVSANAVPYNDHIDLITIKNDLIYFGGVAEGIYEYNPNTNQFRNWTTQNGLSNNYINGLAWDQAGDLWIGTNNGLNRLEIEKEVITAFYTQHGLSSNIIVHLQNDEKGNIILCTAKSTQIFDPRDIDEVENPYPVRISELKINNTSANNLLLDGTSNRLNYKENNISIELSQVDLVNGVFNNYQYRLQNMDLDEWMPFNAGNQLQLLGLSPGTYAFQFRVCSNTNNCGETQPFVILIRPPFWRSVYFFIVLVAIVIALFGFYHRLRVRGLIKQQTLRNQISADLHDDIGSSISTIGFMSEILSQEGIHSFENQQRLESIKEEIGSISHNLEEIIWYIKPSSDTLEEVHLKLRRFSTEILESKNIQLSWEQTEVLKNTTIENRRKRDYFLIFKEIINNAAKHSQATLLSVKIELINHNLKIVVADNGVGFDPDKTYTSNGMLTLKARTKQLNGDLHVDSALGMGSRITLIFSTS